MMHRRNLRGSLGDVISIASPRPGKYRNVCQRGERGWKIEFDGELLDAGKGSYFSFSTPEKYHLRCVYGHVQSVRKFDLRRWRIGKFLLRLGLRGGETLAFRFDVSPLEIRGNRVLRVVNVAIRFHSVIGIKLRALRFELANWRDDNLKCFWF